MTEPRFPIVLVDVSTDDAEEMGARLFELGAEGVEERDDSTLQKGAGGGRATLVASFATPEEAAAARAAIGDAARLDEIVGDAWRDAWKEHYRPFEVAPGIVVRPPWTPYAPKEGELVLELEPGRAFGTGLHETTRLVAGALARNAAALKDALVIDVGTGSGILAFIALALGAARAVCVDIDPDAVAVTRENAARNALAERVTASTTAAADITERAPIVLANIEAKALIPMAADLSRLVSPGGLLLLSGVLTHQRDEVVAAYPALEVVESPAMGEWILISLRAPG
ncbi:MAG: 50S ribosomal protein L11 methyltransferase [Myxococcales bacterium]|nr:50S ribosomal protein L11 methyltransferase [Myxococcales bacterium]